MDRNYLFIPVILGLLLLAGCTGGNNPNNIVDPFIGGNLALKAYLGDGAPPPQVLDSGKMPFGVNLVIENVGESNIGPGTENPYASARLEGVNPVEFGVTDADLRLVLDQTVTGAKKNMDGTILGGMPANFIFPNLNFQGKLVGNQLYTLRGVVCYDYSNTATMQVCMTNDILQNVQDTTICTTKGERVVHNSGGPIHITHVTQNPVSNNKTQVNFMIEHVGMGEFYGRSATEDCNPNVRNMNKYWINVQVSMHDPNSKISCYRLNNTGQGSILLYNGVPQTITCTIDRSTATNMRIYTDTLTVKTYYRYGQFIEQPIIVQATPEGS